jgi:hypothetical protein
VQGRSDITITGGAQKGALAIFNRNKGERLLLGDAGSRQEGRKREQGELPECRDL